MNKSLSLSLCLVCTTFAAAQTQPLRGSVDRSPANAALYLLDGTNLPMTSSMLDLGLLLGQQMIFDVVNSGTIASPVLDVVSAVTTTQVFDMGALRVGRTDTWQVNALAGSVVFVFADFTPFTGYQPLGAYGTYLLGSNPQTIISGVTDAISQFEFSFAVPLAAAPLVGTMFTAQALVGDHGTWFFSNADHKAVTAQ